MASKVSAELKVKCLCDNYLNTAGGAMMSCKYTYIPPTEHFHLSLMMAWKPKLSFSDISQVIYPIKYFHTLFSHFALTSSTTI